MHQALEAGLGTHDKIQCEPLAKILQLGLMRRTLSYQWVACA